MQPTYMHMAATLEPLVDLFLCETLSSTAETMAAASAASMSGQHCQVLLLWVMVLKLPDMYPAAFVVCTAGQATSGCFLGSAVLPGA